ncbi:transcriptional regulator [Thermococcus nautili]|uniref:Putative transcriptional regulators n=1 Tax=Thermococcus nautili TaxID=195522 RepID=W8P3P4_9EURY|nr:transcriptional regulator [Thermococcus nautili]AHL23406.1 putative transcriptional regulators [Thermococcus nautili]NJE49620.1 transcriptional regulator [Thermococcus sp. 9N3]CAI1492652.1 Putative transcriptional regulators [Thermococcus nautili]
MREVIIITQPEKVKVLSDETRFKILQLLRQRPMTIWELSMAIGKDRTTIYRHVKALEKAGFVEELGSEGNEKLYGRTARLFLIKAEPHESVENFRQAYLQVEAERLVRILEKAGIGIKDREKLKELVKDILNEIEINSQPFIRRISEANVELSEIELFHFLNMLVFLQSCELCEMAEKVKKLIEV